MTQPPSPCQVCYNLNHNKMHTAREMMFGTREEFDYLECAHCGCVQLVNVPNDMAKYYPLDYYSFKEEEIKHFDPVRAFLRKQKHSYCLHGKNFIGKMLVERAGMPPHYSWLRGGHVNFASVPMMLSGVLNRVAFPAYSRLQSDPEALGRYLISSIRRISALLCLIVPLVVIVCPILIPVLFRARWTPAVPLVQWFSLECIVMTILGLVAAAQNALGYSGDRLAITLVMGGIRWMIGFLAVQDFGLAGIGPATFAVTVVDLVVTIFLLRRRYSACSDLFSEVFRPLVLMLSILGLSLVTGYIIAHGNALRGTIISLVTFLSVTFVSELLAAKRPLTKEFQQMVHMLKPIQNLD